MVLPRGLSWQVRSALAGLYLIWGSTYLAARYSLETLPPLTSAGYRFFLAGLILYTGLRLRGRSDPGLRAWLLSLVAGGFMLLGGSGLLALAIGRVPSGLAAVVIASVGMWTPLFSGLFGVWPRRQEWVGILIGLIGVGLLNWEGGLKGYPWGTILLILSAMSWALGSVLSARLPAPAVPMPSALQMVSGGLLLVIAGHLHGEHLAGPVSLRSGLAFAYLLVVGSVLGFSLYGYLLDTVSPALATSYAYVNPLVAVILGVVLGGEKIGPVGVLALFLILLAVATVVAARSAPEA